MQLASERATEREISNEIGIAAKIGAAKKSLDDTLCINLMDHARCYIYASLGERQCVSEPVLNERISGRDDTRRRSRWATLFTVLRRAYAQPHLYSITRNNHTEIVVDLT
jgi:hypothetical protein